MNHDPLPLTTILVAEDNRSVRMLLRVVLEAAGATVLEAEDGAIARRLIDLNPTIDVVCTDLHMPNVDGIELAAGLLTTRPHLPVVVCSAAEATLNPSSLPANVAAVIRKPFIPQELVQALAEAINESPDRASDTTDQPKRVSA